MSALNDVGRDGDIHLMLAGDGGPALSAREDENLVDSVHFVADVASDGDLHGDELRVEPGVEDFPELAEGSHFGRQLGEVDHLVLGGIARDVRIFAHGCCGRGEGSEGGGTAEDGLIEKSCGVYDASTGTQHGGSGGRAQDASDGSYAVKSMLDDARADHTWYTS